MFRCICSAAIKCTYRCIWQIYILRNPKDALTLKKVNCTCRCKLSGAYAVQPFIRLKRQIDGNLATLKRMNSNYVLQIWRYRKILKDRPGGTHFFQIKTYSERVDTLLSLFYDKWFRKYVSEKKWIPSGLSVEFLR